MKCTYCGAQAEPQYIYCLVCGTKLEPEKKTEPAAPVSQFRQEAECEFPRTHAILEEIFGPEEEWLPPVEEITDPAEEEREFPVEPCIPSEHDEEIATEQPLPIYTTAPLRRDVVESIESVTKPEAPACKSLLRLPVGRSLLKMALLGLITGGIYPMVIWSRIVTEMNIVASREDGKVTMSYFAMLMLTPITLGIYTFVWMHRFCDRVGQQLQARSCNYRFDARDFWLWLVLGSLILVGPYVFTHKLMKSMNLINSHYNTWG